MRNRFCSPGSPSWIGPWRGLSQRRPTERTQG